MFTTVTRNKSIGVLAAMIAVSLLAACSGSDGSSSNPPVASCFETSIQNCGSGPWDPFGIALSLAWISGQCTQEVLCTNEEVVTNFDDGIVTDDFIADNWTTSSATESEPNSSPAEATPFVIQGNSGILITGTVNDSTDAADYVALSFGPIASENAYIAYLCRTPDDCLQPWYSGDEIYIDLLDQNETIIQTTNMTQSHYISFAGTQGVLYFIGVRANNTNGLDFDYKLVMTD